MGFLFRLCDRLAGAMVRRKWWILAAFVILIILSLAASRGILMRTQLQDMLPASDPLVRSFNQVSDLFSTSSIILTFEAPERKGMIRAAEDAKALLERDKGISPYIETIQLELPMDFVKRWGLFMQEAEEIRRSRTMFSTLNILPFITALNDNLENSYTGDEAEEEILTHQDERRMVEFMSSLERAMVRLREYLEAPESSSVTDTAGKLSELLVMGDRYTFDSEGRMLLMTIVPAFSITDYDRLLRMMPEFRRVLADIAARHPGVKISYTGDLTREFDEQAALSFDLLVPSLIALALILVLFVFSFPRVRTILLALVALVAGIVLDVGIIGVTLRELNMLTTSFAVILIGLGIDFAIHVVSNYTDFRAAGLSEQACLRETFRKAGSSIIIGGMTTAIAFFVLMISDSKAITQFGFIAGWGIITCLASTLVLLPVLLLVFEAGDVKPSRRGLIDYAFLGGMGKWCRRRRIAVISLVAVLTVVWLLLASGNRMEYNINNLTVSDSPSSLTERRIQAKFNLSTQASMVIASSVAEARRYTEILKNESLVSRVASVSEFIPAPEEARRRLHELALFRRRPPGYQRDYHFERAGLRQLMHQIQRLEWNVIELGDLSVAALGEGNLILEKRNAMIREIFGAEVGRPGREVFGRVLGVLGANATRSIRLLNRLDEPFSRAMADTVDAMIRIDRPMELGDIPEAYARELISPDQKEFLITVMPTEAVRLEAGFMAFNERMGRIHPGITGSVQLAVQWSREMVAESRRAAVYVFAAILLLLALMFRRIQPVLVQAGFLLVALAWMFGLFPLLGIRLNLMSVLALPMLIGLGIDYAVHIVHRYMLEKDIGATMTRSGKAVLLSAVTTGFGFGSLALFGTMAAIAGFGQALFIGVAACLFLTFVLLPALSSYIPVGPKARRRHKETVGTGSIPGRPGAQSPQGKRRKTCKNT